MWVKAPTVHPQRQYSAQWVRYRLWLYSAAEGSGAWSKWVQVRVDRFGDTGGYFWWSPGRGRWVVYTGVQWWNGLSWFSYAQAEASYEVLGRGYTTYCVL
jgi:hypothetical protein